MSSDRSKNGSCFLLTIPQTKHRTWNSEKVEKCTLEISLNSSHQSVIENTSLCNVPPKIFVTMESFALPGTPFAPFVIAFSGAVDVEFVALELSCSSVCSRSSIYRRNSWASCCRWPRNCGTTFQITMNKYSGQMAFEPSPPWLRSI